MPLQSYLPAPAQPGWPNLPDQGIPLVNAVAAATAMSMKRDEIQGRLAQLALKNQEMEANEALKEKYYNIALEKVGMQAEHNAFLADMSERRLRDSEDNQRELRDIAWANYARQKDRADELTKIAEDKLKAKDDLDKLINEYASAHTQLRADALSGKGPKIGSAAYDLERTAIDEKYAQLRDTTAGRSIYNTADRESDTAKRFMHQAWVERNTKLEEAISVSTKGRDGISPIELSELEDNRLGKTGNVPEGQSWVAHDTTTGNIVTPKEVADNYKDKDPRLRFTTMYDVEWARLRKQAREALYPDGDPRTLDNMPGLFKGKGRSEPGEDDIKHLKNNPTPVIKQRFDTEFGKGSADYYLSTP